MPIRILPEEVASKIAAGEVVERPASVVKELVENSIDAGAGDVKVEMQEGGRRLIRVIDDGEGISADEVPVAFERYATSKLEAVEDLSHIATLGFRGEALSSIAAVSQLAVTTKAKGEGVGTLLRLEGGRVVRHEPHGAAQGTVVTVENLFYNTPARLKFLRSQATEGRHVTELVTCYAMAFPRLRFVLLSDGRRAFQSKGSGDLYEVLMDVYGLETAQQMLKIDRDSTTKSAIVVHGFVSDPALHRSRGRHLITLVNGRWVRDRLISYAIREAYHTLLPRGRHPIAVVKVDLPPDQVDVNVHPAKSEVRFRNSGDAFAAVQKAVRQTLARKAPVPRASSSFGWERGLETRQRRLVEMSRSMRPTRGELALKLHRTGEQAAAANGAPLKGKLPMLRVLGQVGGTYVIAEGPTGMFLIDQHAAHERVLYERFQTERAEARVSSQRLLEPLVLEPGPRQAALMQERLVSLEEFGFEIEPFGGDTYLVRAVPAILQGTDLPQTILDIADEADNRGRVDSWQETVTVNLACHGAVQAGQTLSMQQMRDLVQQLEETKLPRTCPHGRPTILHVSAEQLQREFGRK
ncbi:MAG: DNA mismatch repair endonuclease MutL [Anaerolineae bacterium]